MQKKEKIYLFVQIILRLGIVFMKRQLEGNAYLLGRPSEKGHLIFRKILNDAK